MGKPAILRSFVWVLVSLSSLCADAQWTRLSEYIPSSSRSPNPQPQPLQRAAHSLVVFRDVLYVFGGVGDTTAAEDYEFDDTWKYEILNDRWTAIVGDRQGSPTGGGRGRDGLVSPQHRFHHSTAVHSNGSVDEMIVFGGLSIALQPSGKGPTSVDSVVTQFNDVWRLTLQPDGQETWRQDAPMVETNSSSSSGSSSSLAGFNRSPTQVRPPPRSEAGAVVHANQLFVFGGIAYEDVESSTPIDFGDLWCYDLSNETWSQLLPSDGIAPPARFSHSVDKFTTDEGETFLVVFSGRHLQLPSWSLLDDTWIFSLTTKRWRLVQTAQPVQRAYTSVVTTGGASPKLWFFGGYFRANAGTSGFVYDDVVGGYLNLADSGNTQIQFYRALVGQNDAVPPLRYTHRAVLWRDAMIIHGGSYQSQRGDVWMFNLTTADMRQDPAAALPVDMQTLVYVLAGFVFSIVAVLVILIVRWRRIDRRNMELARRRGVPAARGIPRERLDQMGIIKYRKPPQTEPAPPASPNGADDADRNDEDVCPICLVEFEEGEDVRNLPCNHIFHVACIDEWLGRNTTCPMCKNNLDLDVVDVEIRSDSPTGQRDARQASGAAPLPSPLRSPSVAATPQLRGGSIVTPVGTEGP